MGQLKDRRTYDQQCGLAYALDVLGERWTLLIVRELLIRPRRYGELLDALQGIGTNLLADRLGFLVEAGLVRPLDAHRRTAGYALTELGERMREPVLSLARFGLTYAAHQPPPAASVARPAWAILATDALLDGSRTPGVDEVYGFDVDGEQFHVVVEEGRAVLHPSPAVEPTLQVKTDAVTFFQLGARRLDPLEAVLSGAVQVAGPPAAMSRCLRLLGLAGTPAG
ncbi:winged helix-turn-helix transcriptional regulator [Micromonospora sp. NPDC018662]|uniref:winged helix-turn-helix transcriptional regulator n=1 Tax=Micromonospora sp. NPDC018662 TaxID=3364238 RepID=UPI00379C02E4